MSRAEVMVTARELLASLRIRLESAALPDARREAIHLWSAVSGRAVGSELLHEDRGVDPEQVEQLDRLVERRLAGEPLAYVTGSMDFRHLTLRSDSRALIPRPETEGLVEVALQGCRTGVVADIGTGTGAIALSLRHDGSFDEVIGVDLSPAALELARFNAASCGLAVTWLQGDLLAPLSGRRLDLLVSNPPYLTAEEYLTCDPSVRDYEPEMALVSGADGMDAIGRLLSEGVGMVAEGGWIALEVDSSRAQAAAALAESAGWSAVEVLDDLFGRARYLRAQLRSSR